MDSWIRIMVIFVVFIFVQFGSFFLLTGPVDELIDAFAGVDAGAGQTEYDSQISITRSIVPFFFALFISIPFAWLVGVVFSREATFGYQRRY